MGATKRARRKRANKNRPASQGKGITATPAIKRSVKKSLGVIKNDAKDIELRIGQVLDTLDEVDFIDS